jgi:hypothetical protein
MRLGDRAVRGVMTPRTEVDWINLAGRDEAATRKLFMETQHSRLPAGEGSVDAMVGVIQTRELLAALLAGPLDPRKHVRTARSSTTRRTRSTCSPPCAVRSPMALVHDEYGHFEGVVSPGRHPRGHHRRVPLRPRRGRRAMPSSARTGPGCWPATCRPTRWPTSSASTCRKTATTRRSPATSCRILQSPARDRRMRRRAGLALRGRRPRRPPHRQGAGDANRGGHDRAGLTAKAPSGVRSRGCSSPHALWVRDPNLKTELSCQPLPWLEATAPHLTMRAARGRSDLSRRTQNFQPSW